MSENLSNLQTCAIFHNQDDDAGPKNGFLTCHRPYRRASKIQKPLFQGFPIMTRTPAFRKEFCYER